MNKKISVAITLFLIGFVTSSILTHLIPAIGDVVAPGNWMFGFIYGDLCYFGGDLLVLLAVIFAIRGYLEIRRTNEKGKYFSLAIIAFGAFKLLILFLFYFMHTAILPLWIY
jgi:hypothetical protein